MGQALYRKYRSKSLDEIIGQPHITTVLANALKSGAISHAYLFSGPRGTGKTSIARILAHEINQLPYESDSTHLDIIEIDAASNRRIDEIRELRERVHTAPTSSKYKVYIIDEVHMLTREAFNALLKTLEEPPAHAVFILATTEAHKLPETIVSRTQRFTFKPVEQDKVVEHLRHIAKQEGVTISDEALGLIAAHGGGSFRDSISLLDQIRGHGDKVTETDVQGMLGIAPDAAINQLISILAGGTPADLITVLSDMKQNGYQAGQLAKQLAGLIRTDLLAGITKLPSENLPILLHKLLDVPASADPETHLELVLLDTLLQRTPLPQASPEKVEPVVATKPVKSVPQQPVAEPIKKQETPEAPVEQPTKPVEKKATKPAVPSSDISLWNDVLNSLKKTHNTLYGVARMADASFQGDELILGMRFAFHQRRLNESKNKQVISEVVNALAGRDITVTCVLVSAGATDEAPVAGPAPAQNETISTISNIFGGAEVLDS